MLILFAIFSASLRLTSNGMTSFYRMLAPAAVVFILARSINRYKKDLVFFAAMMIYSTVVSIVFYNNIEIEQIVFTVYVFFLYILIKETKIRDRRFEGNFWGFIHIVTTATIILAWIQHFTFYVMPFRVPPMKKGAMSVYFTNENELGAALAAIFIIYLYILVFTKKKFTAVMAFNTLSIPVIVYINDAKLSMLGIIAAVLMFGVYYLRKKGVLKKMKDSSFLKIIVISMASLIIGLYILNPTIHTRDYDMSIRNMIFDALIAILKRQELEGNGTYRQRSSAIIYGLRELVKSYGFGIGIGNSIKMLSKPEYYLRYAKSMHNIIMQFLVELGYFGAGVYLVIFYRIRKMFTSVQVREANMLRVVFFVALIFISSQSSAGFLSNYLEIAVIMYISLMDPELFSQYCCRRRRIVRSTVQN